MRKLWILRSGLSTTARAILLFRKGYAFIPKVSHIVSMQAEFELIPKIVLQSSKRITHDSATQAHTTWIVDVY